MPTIRNINPPPGKTVRFISDLHYGHERCEAPAPAELARTLLTGIDILVVAGDLAETRPGPWRHSGEQFREQLRTECHNRKIELVELAGNHDPDTECLMVRFWEGRVVAMHGHALYKEVAPWGWEFLHHKDTCRKLIRETPHDTLEGRLELSRKMSLLLKPMMRRENIRNKYIRGFLHCFWPPQRPWNIIFCWLNCAGKAERFARRFFPEAEVVILGHFHRSGEWKFGRRRIFSCGAWFKHATPYCVDMKDARILGYTKLQTSR